MTSNNNTTTNTTNTTNSSSNNSNSFRTPTTIFSDTLRKALSPEPLFKPAAAQQVILEGESSESIWSPSGYNSASSSRNNLYGGVGLRGGDGRTGSRRGSEGGELLYHGRSSGGGGESAGRKKGNAGYYGVGEKSRDGFIDEEDEDEEEAYYDDFGDDALLRRGNSQKVRI
jgi:hypothetical protein